MRRVYGTKATRLTLGDLLSCHRLWSSRGDQKGQQKSAEAIVAAPAPGGEGPNTRSRTGTQRSSCAADAEEKAEMPEQSLGVGDGITEGKVTERQTQTAPRDSPGPGAVVV